MGSRDMRGNKRLGRPVFRTYPYSALLVKPTAALLFVACAAAALAACRHEVPRSPVPPAAVRVDEPAAFDLDASAARIDAALERAWKRRAVTPAEPADDATFLRRVTLDLTGTIPTPAEVTSFLTDARSDKRPRVVDRLLASSAYVEHWTNYWDATLLGLKVNGQVDRAAFRAWLRERIAANVPWNQLVYELLTAEGTSSPGGSRKDRNLAIAGMGLPAEDAVSRPIDVEDRGQTPSAGVNGAVNFAVKFLDAPADYPSTVSRVFLGVQIQCAQCHDHKTEAWKQTDFQRFAAGALHFKTKSEKAADGDIQVVAVEDSAKILSRVGKDPDAAAIAKAQPASLDGVTLAKGDKTREAFAAWIVDPRSPFFGRAYANRMWAHLLGRGFVDPIDDIRPGNAPQAPEVFDAVTQELVAGGYDPKRLLGALARTRAYGLSSRRAKSAAGGPAEIELFSSFRLVPLGPTELLSALSQATAFESAQSKKRGNLAQAKLALVRSFQNLFDVDEEFESESFEGSLAQALTLLNGGTLVTATTAAKGTALADILAASPGEDTRIAALYLRVLSRPATADEIARSKAFLATQRSLAAGGGANAPRSAKAEAQAYGDLLLALLNSSEFFFNH